jgi:hypothetical protein
MSESIVIKSNYKRTLYAILFIVLSVSIMVFRESENRNMEEYLNLLKMIIFSCSIGIIFNSQYYHSCIVQNEKIVLKHFILGTTVINCSTLKNLKVTHIPYGINYEPSFLFILDNGGKKKILMNQPKWEYIEIMLAYLETRGIKIEIDNPYDKI